MTEVDNLIKKLKVFKRFNPLECCNKFMDDISIYASKITRADQISSSLDKKHFECYTDRREYDKLSYNIYSFKHGRGYLVIIHNMGCRLLECVDVDKQYLIDIMKDCYNYYNKI